MKKYGMMYQVQCGDAVKKVSGIAAPPSASRNLLHPPLPNPHERDQAEHRAGRRRKRATLGQGAARQLRFCRQAVDLGVVDQEIEGVQATQRTVRVITVELGAFLSLGLQLVHAFLRPDAELGDRSELDRIGGTGL